MTQTPSPRHPSRHAALSPSRVKELRQCPLKFRLRNIDAVPEPPSPEALRGTLVHSVLEHLFDLPPAERTPARALAMLDERWAELQASREQTDIFASEEERARWLESAKPLVSSYFVLEDPEWLEPVGRERFVNAVLPSGLAVRGIIDRLDQAPSGALRVVDYKTGKSPSPRFQDEYIFQMRFYAMALHYERGVLPKRTQLLFLKDARALTFDPPEDTPARTAQEMDDAWAEIENRIEADRFEPRESVLCNWCSLHRLCPAKGGTAPQTSAEGVAYLKTAVRPVPPAALS